MADYLTRICFKKLCLRKNVLKLCLKIKKKRFKTLLRNQEKNVLKLSLKIKIKRFKTPYNTLISSTGTD